MSIKQLATACLVIGLGGLVTAGPGASMNACINTPVAPDTAYTVNFQAGSGTDRCMNNRGSSSSITVNRQGVICTSIGYVEAKTSSSDGDLCATDESHWGVSWRTPDGKYSGSTDSRWYSSHKIALHGQSENTHVCGSGDSCTDTSKTWSGTGELWIIFEPKSYPSVMFTSQEQTEQHVMDGYGPDL